MNEFNGDVICLQFDNNPINIELEYGKTVNIEVDMDRPGATGPQGPIGPEGKVGPPNELSIGTVVTGLLPAATITGVPPEQILNLVLPKGDPGDPGVQGAIGQSINIIGTLPTPSDLPVSANPGDSYFIEVGDELHLFTFNYDGQWIDAGNIRGPEGEVPELNDVVYNPTTSTIDAGSVSSGTLSNVYQLYGDTYVIDEKNTTPGYDVKFNFTDVVDFNRLRLHFKYYGDAPSHIVRIELYNYTTSTFDFLTDFMMTDTFTFLDLPVVPTNYIDTDGDARVRFNHNMTGNITHKISFDYVALVKSYAGSPGPKGDKGDQGPQGEKGDTGFGIPTGGTTGQVIVKNSNTDYDIGWGAGGGGGGDAFDPIEVTLTTASGTPAKVGTTASGNYVPQENDILRLNFTNGCNASNVTLNIDGYGAINLKMGGANVTTMHIAITTATIVLCWFDGEHYQLFGSNNNTLVYEISEAEAVNGANGTLRGITGRRLDYLLNNKVKTVNGESLVGTGDLEITEVNGYSFEVVYEFPDDPVVNRIYFKTSP